MRLHPHTEHVPSPSFRRPGLGSTGHIWLQERNKGPTVTPAEELTAFAPVTCERQPQMTLRTAPKRAWGRKEDYPRVVLVRSRKRSRGGGSFLCASKGSGKMTFLFAAGLTSDPKPQQSAALEVWSWPSSSNVTWGLVRSAGSQTQRI